MQREPPRALSFAAECKPDDVAAIADMLDAVHQTMHQKKSAPVLAHNGFGSWLDSKFLHVEVRAFIGDVEHYRFVADHSAYSHVLALPIAIPSNDCVRERLR